MHSCVLSMYVCIQCTLLRLWSVWAGPPPLAAACVWTAWCSLGPAFVVASAVPRPHPSRADHWDEDSSETRSAKPSSVELASRRWCGYSQRHGPVMYTACISTLPRRSQRGDIVPTAASGEVACPTLLVLPRSVFSRTPYHVTIRLLLTARQ